jgi:hypothetical protein
MESKSIKKDAAICDILGEYFAEKLI